jgi:hypothetical protein
MLSQIQERFAIWKHLVNIYYKTVYFSSNHFWKIQFKELQKIYKLCLMFDRPDYLSLTYRFPFVLLHYGIKMNNHLFSPKNDAMGGFP